MSFMSFPDIKINLDIGKYFSAFEEFDNTHYDNVDIINVYIGLKPIFSWSKYIGDIGPNHWSIILELSNQKYICIQFDSTGKIDLKARNSLREASLLTWGKGNTTRLSCYGPCKYNYNKFLDSLNGEHWYIALVNDCQNFSRKVVKELTGKNVEVFPPINGPIFQNDDKD